VKPRLETVRNGTPELDFKLGQFARRDRRDITRRRAWVGVLDNENAGRSLRSLMPRHTRSDFYLEAWIYAQVTRGEKGPLNGIAFLIDSGMLDRRQQRFHKGRFGRGQIANIRHELFLIFLY